MFFFVLFSEASSILLELKLQKAFLLKGQDSEDLFKGNVGFYSVTFFYLWLDLFLFVSWPFTLWHFFLSAPTFLSVYEKLLYANVSYVRFKKSGHFGKK